MRELEQQVERLVSQYLEEAGAVYVSAAEVGLDYRCGGVHVSIDEDFIAVISATNSIEYYGGFEYIDNDYKTTIGNVTFYSGEARRVQECIEHYIENVELKKAEYTEKIVKSLTLKEESSPPTGLNIEIKASSNSEVIIEISNSCTLRLACEDAERLASAVSEASTLAEKFKK